MRITSRGEYALRALIILGLEYDREQALVISDISDKTMVPVSYLEQILLQLKMLGHVKSKRGKFGGYMLRETPEKINIGEVIRQLEGPLAPMSCVSMTAYEPCPLEGACLLQPLWSMIRDLVADVLDKTTLRHLLEGNIPHAQKTAEV